MESDYETSAALIRSSFKRLFETLMAQTADRIYIKDTQGRFVFVSDALARTHGVSNHCDIEGMTDFDFFDKETAQNFYNEEQAIMETNIPLINRVEKELWIDGSTTWASQSKSPLQLDTGETIGLIGISRDVTEQHLSKERLRQQNETMLEDYSSAAEVQSVMIPGRIPDIDDIEIAYLWKPMAAVGGDIINFPRNPDKKLLFFLADVCGHGVQAAFYTVLLKYMTAQAAEFYNGDPKIFLDTVNEQISHRLNKGFITAIAGHFESDTTGRHTLHVSNAGHPELIIQRRAERKVELVKLPRAIVMGLTADDASKTMQIELSHGDRVFAFTDGIIEASDANDQEFNCDRLLSVISESMDLPLKRVLERIFEATTAHVGMREQQDDISLLAFQVV